MKKINIFITTSLTALAVLASCKKLNLYPSNAIEISQSFKTVKDATTWDNGVYAKFRGVQYGSYSFYTEVQADELNATLDYGNRNGAPGRWDGTFTADDQTLGPQWQNFYNAIANVNVAINGYPTIPATAASDIASINQYLGDAYLARAYYYHRLILRWAKPYEPATAATDLGVPLVLTYDISALPARATVKAVYDQIISDITKAENLLAGTAGAQGSKYFTIDAARALEARVRLSMQDWTGAYNAANTLITGGKYPLITSQAAFSAYWATDGVQETIMQMAVNSSELPNVNNIYLGLRAADLKYDPDFVPSQWVINMYASADIRKAAYFAQLPVIVQGVNYPNTWLVNKYPGNPIYFTTAITNYVNVPKVFRIAEMYLIAAEAAKNANNEPNALIALNALRIARGLTPSVSTGAALTQDIRDERFRELAFEGFRLDDLKRWHLGFTRNSPQNANMLTQGSQYYTLSVAADADKFVWGIPTNDIVINKNLVQNPGW
ncbi:hypothetical protein BEL04_06020 [Mucilaginibacter sp. PPCGB 2223]|uniref:RagB/SusD family nutrient uptake outer membrane protein n=1 Tax=Mucilaginibacter sp. PPCGB 2223 TaxID=1886027 RepID=UPI0008266AE3|nr:RagB/SusD family nutrient uptake outer membrane protein [Mucilaginibacter sp. PPCGB 2223]OCX53839.1 hypothetical protein BEL04_06020 [Mucilaginibacter sp. PPCGB 2223]